MAAIIPADVKSNIPIISPIGPRLVALAKAPWISKWPKLVIGTKAPPPAHNIILS